MQNSKAKILTEKGFIARHIEISDILKRVKVKYNQNMKLDNMLIVPPFFNMHTHIGDAFIKKMDMKLPRTVPDLVAPPHGLKHRLLRSVDPHTIIAGMIEAIRTMDENGISYFCDFRENAVPGISYLREAIQQSHTTIKGCIMGRPEGLSYDQREIAEILHHADGIGLSSISEWEFSEIESIANDTHKAGKFFAVHASESTREDIEKILALQPSFLIHCTHATKKDLERIKTNKVPIVICPRSNHYFGIPLHLDIMKKVGNTLFIGTDNAMMHSPSILDEIQFIMQKYPSVFSLEDLFLMATFQPRKALNLIDSIPDSTLPASLLVVHQKSLAIMMG